MIDNRHFGVLAHTPKLDEALAILRRLHCVIFLQRACGPRNLSECLCNHAKSLCFVDTSRDHGYGIVRLVVFPVKSLGTFDWHILQIVLRSDRGFAVVMPEVCRGSDTGEKY